MRRVTGRVHNGVRPAHVGAAQVAPPPSSPPPPYPTMPTAWRQIGIGVAVMLISGALLGVATKLFARPVSL
jgi:hypothetical protein